jgi:hypothetical protein
MRCVGEGVVGPILDVHGGTGARTAETLKQKQLFYKEYHFGF